MSLSHIRVCKYSCSHTVPLCILFFNMTYSEEEKKKKVSYNLNKCSSVLYI